MKKSITLLLALLIASLGFSQTDQQVQNMQRKYNVKKLKALGHHYGQLFRKEKDKAFDYAMAHKMPIVKTLENGHRVYLTRMAPNGTLLYRTLYNIDAATTVGTPELYEGGSLGLNLAGENMTVGIWDGGAVLEDHELLDGKV